MKKILLTIASSVLLLSATAKDPYFQETYIYDVKTEYHTGDTILVALASTLLFDYGDSITFKIYGTAYSGQPVSPYYYQVRLWNRQYTKKTYDKDYANIYVYGFVVTEEMTTSHYAIYANTMQSTGFGSVNVVATPNGLEEDLFYAKAKPVAYYDMNGSKMDKPVLGVFMIVVYSDGRVRKIVTTD